MCAEKIELSVHVLQLRGSAAACVSKLQNFNSFALMRNTKGGDRWSTFEGKFHPEIRELQRRIIIIKLRLLFYKVHAQGFFSACGNSLRLMFRITNYFKRALNELIRVDVHK